MCVHGRIERRSSLSRARVHVISPRATVRRRKRRLTDRPSRTRACVRSLASKPPTHLAAMPLMRATREEERSDISVCERRNEHVCVCPIIRSRSSRCVALALEEESVCVCVVGDVARRGWQRGSRILEYGLGDGYRAEMSCREKK